MITSKRNLEVVNLTRVDKNIPVLDCVHIESNGISVGGNGRCFIAVSPVKEKIKKVIEKLLGKTETQPVNVSSTTVKEILKNLPADRKMKGLLEHTDVVSNDTSKVKFVIYDGSRKRSIDGKANNMQYPPYRKIFSKVLNNKQSLRFAVNAKRLLSLFETMVKCSGDTSDFSPMYIEFTNQKEMIVRMINPKTEQECIGVMLPYNENEAPWIESLQLEEELKNDARTYNNSGKTISESNDLLSGGNDNGSSGSRFARKLPAARSNLQNRGRAKKTGSRMLARIIDEMCPECDKYHLASDGKAKWCSCKRGCNYYEKIN